MDEDDLSFCIDVTVADDVPPPDLNSLREAVAHTLESLRCQAAEVRVSIVSDATMATLNERFLGHDGPTDCITFDLSDSDDATIDGEIVVSADTALRQAAIREHDPKHEIALYAIHGTLHLLGFDDKSPESAAEMHAIEDKLLTELGIGPIFARESA
jgi:probable rRNA maturation factor